MRCKLGDLAVLLAGNYEADNGKIVEVIEWCEGYCVPSWVIRSRGTGFSVSGGRMTATAADDALHPINPPGVEAETVRELEAVQ